MRRKERGFTLMELMVVIVIVAILAAVAVPLYINYVKDAKRTEAKGAIAAIISAEQVYYQENPSIGYLQDGDLTDETGLKVDLDEVDNNWAFAITAAGPDGFTVTADGRSGGPADGIQVQMNYSRTTGPVWLDTIQGGE